MSTQPNALRLANRLENDLEARDGSNLPMYAQAIADSAACELRAQHELIQKLTAALETCRYVLSIESLTFTADIAQKAIDAAEAHK
jgi:hypothetical protein